MANRYWVGGSGTWDASDTSHWSASTGGSSGASVPTRDDVANFDTASHSGDYTCTTSGVLACSNLFMSNPNNAANTLTFAGSATIECNGSLAYSIINFTNTGALTFTYDGGSSGINIIPDFRTTWTAPIVVNAPNKTYNITSTMITSNGITLTAGTLETDNNDVTCGFFSSNNSNTRTLTLGTSTITIQGFTGTVWNLGVITGFTGNMSSATIRVNISNSSVRSMSGQSQVYGTIETFGAGAGSLTFLGALDVATLKSTTPPKTITFNRGSTYSIGEFKTNGTAGNLVSMLSSAGGVNWKASSTSAQQSINYVSIRDCQVQTAGKWWAGANSTDAGGNSSLSGVPSGWRFAAPPVVSQDVKKPEVSVV